VSPCRCASSARRRLIPAPPTPSPAISLSRHTDDVYDVAWSPCSRFVVTASVDNSAIVWDVPRARDVATLSGHSQFVQGVAWDPAGSFIATQSNDRSVRVFKQAPTQTAGKVSKSAAKAAASPPAFKCVQVIKARAVSASASSESIAPVAAPATGGAPAKTYFFLDETVPSFFRRLSWTPDGSLLLTPTGAMPGISTTFAFSRNNFSEPIAHFPGAGSARPSVAVRASPILYAHRDAAAGGAASSGNGAFILPYRMLFAVATLDAVLVYDTSCPHPVAAVANLHYDKVTDVAWSPSGRTLLLSSIDGYCSMLCFDDADVGTPLARDELPAVLRAVRHKPTYAPPRASKTVRTPARSASDPSAVGAEEDADAEENVEEPVQVPEAAPPAAPVAGAKRKIALTLLQPMGDMGVPEAQRVAVTAEASPEPALVQPAQVPASAPPCAVAPPLFAPGGGMSALEALLGSARGSAAAPPA
jgi:chromatin assembly factor 1 subunit B